jgi:predicted dehydrogenase
MIPHDVSIMNYLLDATPSTVTAWASINSSTQIADMIYVKLDYLKLGLSAYVHASWLGSKKVREVTVVGSKKVAVHDDTMKTRLHIFNRVNSQEDFAGQLLPCSSADILSPDIHFEEPLLVQVRHFLECIDECTLPQTHGNNGLAVVATLEAIERSVTTNSIVRVRFPIDVIPIGVPDDLRVGHVSANQ